MQAGFFTTDITPPLGTMRAGNYRRMYISGIAAPESACAVLSRTAARSVLREWIVVL